MYDHAALIHPPPYLTTDRDGFTRSVGFPWPTEFWDSNDSPWEISRLSNYQGAQYMKLAICHKCGDIVSAGVPTDEDKAAERFNFHRCTCKAVAIAYSWEYPANHDIVITGPANLLAILNDEWQRITEPQASDKRIFYTLMTMPRTATSVNDLDVDPDQPTPQEQPTHYNVTTKAPCRILAQTDMSVVILYVNTGVQHTVDRRRFYENYAELPGEEQATVSA